MSKQATRFPNGVSTASHVGSMLAKYPYPDPTKYFQYYEDWQHYTASEHTVTLVGAGSQAIGTAEFGTLLLTNAAADNDSVNSQVINPLIILRPGKECFFACRFSVSDATQSDWAVGLVVTDTDIMTGITDGIRIQKADDGLTVTGEVVNGSVVSTVTLGTAAASNTMEEWAFSYNGKTGSAGAVEFYRNGAKVGTLPVTNLPTVADNLRMSWAIRNGEAVAKTMSIDYVLAAVER